MELSTIQKSGENNNSQQQKKNQEKSMEKLRETILKLSNKEPDVPLSQTRNSILQKHLNRFLSGLHPTPVHPPYTWMIEKALQELGEERGSTEDSISEFIKKEYGSLPLAHMTLLQHHLHKMTEKGEILMIDGGRFLLPGDSESVNPKRKMKRKRRRYSSIKQKKRQQKQKEEDTQNEVHLEQPTKQHRGRSVKYKEVGAKIDGSRTKALATNDLQDGRKRRRYSSIKQKKRQQKQKEEDTQNEVHLEQPTKQHRGRSVKYKEVGAKIDGSRTKALATNDLQDGVRMKEQKDNRRGRALKGQEDGADPDTTLLKDLRLPKKLNKTSRSRRHSKVGNAVP